MRLVAVCAIVAVCASGVARGQTSIAYDAALGTPPEDQGWIRRSMEPFSVVVEGGSLDASTLPFAQISCANGSDQEQFVYWSPELLDVDFARGACLSARLRVVSSQYIANPCTGWPRPGLSLMLSDPDGHWFWAGLGEDRAFLSNDPYAAFGTSGVVEASVSESGFRLYQIEVIGDHAELIVDGASVLSIEGLGAPLAPGDPAYIGDGTSWANSRVQYRWFAVTPGPCPCAADVDGDGDADGDDFFAYLDLFAAGDTRADLNGDGDRDADDFFAYLDLFAAGC